MEFACTLLFLVFLVGIIWFIIWLIKDMIKDRKQRLEK